MSHQPFISLDYTGHPLIDVGLATITAFADKEHPRDLTDSDFEAIATYMAEQYPRLPLRGFLTVAFPNSGYSQSAYFEKPTDTPEQKQEKKAKIQTYIQRVLYGYRTETPQQELVDAFLGLPVADIPFDVKGELPHGRAFREHIPLQTGQGTINFHPYGDAGLPTSGLSLFAIQAYPLGSAKCAGRTLSVHSDNPEIMVHFARQFLAENKTAIHAAQLENSSKLAEPHLKFKTLLIMILLQAFGKQADSREEEQPFSITAYHLTNSGQGADLAIYHLPSQLIGYLGEMYGASYSTAWAQLVRSAWIRPKLKKGQTAAPDFQPDRNYLYEDLFNLAEDPYKNGRRFIRTYFLREANRFAQNDPTDPRGQYATHREAHLISWKLVQPFLRRILHMDSERIEQIRHLGDALADYVKGQNDKRFFRNFYTENRYAYLRNALIKANTTYVQHGRAPFLTFDNYLAVFEEGEELEHRDWRLARDLVLIRMVEQLHKNGWLGANQDAIADVEPQSETDES